MKKLTILLITILLIYLIYNLFSNKKDNYVIISDVFINDDFFKNKFANYNTFYNSSIVGIYQDIVKNKTIKINSEILYLKKVLRESDIVIISVGMNELANNYNKYDISSNYDYFDKMYLNIIKLIKELKKYAYDKIIFLGYYNPTNFYDSNTDKYFYFVDNKLTRLMIANNITYIPLYEIIKGNNYKENNSVYLNDFGFKKVTSIIDYYLN